MPAVVRQASPVKKAPPTKKPVKSGEVSLRDRITSLSDMPETGIKLLIYGKSKSGKTTLASTCPKKILYLSSETGEVGGMKSIARVKDIFFIQLKTPEDVKEIVESGLAMEYETIVMDTVTQFEAMVLASILGVDKLPEMKSWGMAQREQYAQCGLQVRTYLRALLDLPNNTILLGQERQSDPREDSELIMPTVGVALQPATAGWLNAAVDYIGCTFIRKETKSTKRTVGNKEVMTKEETGKIEYGLRVGPDPVYVTGFRKPKTIVLPDVIVDPSFEKISKFITG